MFKLLWVLAPLRHAWKTPLPPLEEERKDAGSIPADVRLFQEEPGDFAI